MTEYIVGKVDNNEQASSNCVYMQKKLANYIEIKKESKTGIFKVIENSYLTDANMICFNNFQRGWLNATLNSIIICNTQLSSSFEPIKSIKFIAKKLYPKKGQVEITDEMIERLKYELVGIPINAELELIGCSKKVSLIPIIENPLNTYQVIALETEIKIISTDKTIVIETNDTKELFNGKFNFVDIGVGGLDKQFDIIFRRAFLSRLIPDKILKNLGVNHVRGLMLYGPPGCGKTLIARQLEKY